MSTNITLRSIVVTAFLWVCWSLTLSPSWTASLLMFSPAVIVPLSLTVAREEGPQAEALQAIGRLVPIGAATAVLSFLPGPGAGAAAIATIWMLFTVAIAAVGAARLLSRTTLNEAGVAIDAGLIFLSVGGVWLVLSRAGLNPMGFNDAIVQLTAVHFHYAGLALPIVAGVTATRLNRSALVPIAVIAGVPATALGITVGGLAEFAGATLMAAAGIAVAFALLTLGLNRQGHPLLAVAALSLCLGMALAIGWAWATYFDWDYLGLQEMARYHGTLNALGFGLLGLIGLALSAPDAKPTDTVSITIGRPDEAALQTVLERHGGAETTNPAGLLERRLPAGFRRKVWTRRVDHNDFDAAKLAIQQWAGHASASINRFPQTPPIEWGQTLSLAIPVGPIAVTAVSRIVDVVDAADRYGFTYSTLPHHPSDGEESFILDRSEDGSATITVTAVWKMNTLAGRICPPVTTFLQNRAIGQYLDGIAAGVRLRNDPQLQD